jgi:hypothetical protein
MRAITEMPANTPRPIGRTESFFPGTAKAVDDVCSAAAAEPVPEDEAEEEPLAAEPEVEVVGVADVVAGAGAGDEEADELVVEEPVGVAAEFTVETPLTDSAGLPEADALELLAEPDDDAELEGCDEEDVAPGVELELEAGVEDGAPCEELAEGGGFADAAVEDGLALEEFVSEDFVSPPPWAVPASIVTLHFLTSSTTCFPPGCTCGVRVISHVSVTVPNDVSV